MFRLINMLMGLQIFFALLSTRYNLFFNDVVQGYIERLTLTENKFLDFPQKGCRYGSYQ